MKDYIFKNKNFIFLMSLGTLITSLIILIVPILITLFKVEDNKILNYKIIIFISIAMILSVAIQYLIITVREKISVNININHSMELYEKVFQLRYKKFIELGPTYLLDRISNLVSSLYIFLCTTLTSIITNSIISIICIVIVAYYNLYLGILLLFIIPVNYFGYKKLNKTLAKKSIIMQEKSSVGYQNILAIIANPDFIKQYSNYPYTKSYINNELIEIFNSIKEVNTFAQAMSTILRFINIYIQNIVIFIISYDVLKNELGVTPVIVVSIILPIFFNSVSEITRANINSHDVKSGIEFVNSEFSNQNFEVSGTEKLEKIDDIKIIKTNIEQNEIKFTVNGDLHFKKGDIVYISGASGAGKSTLLKSISSIYENDFVLYNNVYLSELKLENIRKQIIYVAQESTILPVSLKDNLKIGSLNENIDFEVKGIDNTRLDEKIYEGGKNLSGGEKQRISLARALYSNPDILLLDEITSNIDEKSTKIIFNELLLKAKNKIIFITSHDESVRDICNKEIVVKKYNN